MVDILKTGDIVDFSYLPFIKLDLTSCHRWFVAVAECGYGLPPSRHTS